MVFPLCRPLLSIPPRNQYINFLSNGLHCLLEFRIPGLGRGQRFTSRCRQWNRALDHRRGRSIRGLRRYRGLRGGRKDSGIGTMTVDGGRAEHAPPMIRRRRDNTLPVILGGRDGKWPVYKWWRSRTLPATCGKRLSKASFIILR